VLGTYVVSSLLLFLCLAFLQLCSRCKQRLKQEQQAAFNDLAAATIERQQALSHAAGGPAAAAAAAADGEDAPAFSCGSNAATEAGSSDGDSTCSDEAAVVDKLEAVLAATVVASDMQVRIVLHAVCFCCVFSHVC
jgi:hypothetical protein